MDDLISRQAAIDALMELIEARLEWKSDASGEINGLNAAYCAIEDLPSAQPNLQSTCNNLATDAISRQAAIDVLDVLCQEHRYKIPGKKETYSQYNEAWQDALDRAEGAIFNLPSAQPNSKESSLTQKVLDSISRQDAIDAIKTSRYLVDAMEKIIRLPSAKPERGKGQWNPFDVPWYQCSVCGAVREQKAFMENFCPNCGADMRGESDGD